MSGDLHERTYVFTDIVDSTVLWEQASDLMPQQLEHHDTLLSEAFARHGGAVFSTMGDGFGVAFERPDDGVAAMIDAQRALRDHDWPDRCTIRVRMGANAGPAHFRGNDYFGPPVNLAARVMAAGHGGQILVSDAVESQLRHVDDVRIDRLGEHRLKGVAQPVPLFGVLADDLDHRFAPLRVLDAGRFTIPAPPTPLIGRDQELEALLDAVRQQRCTTIVAAGGAGKTRLALDVAAAASDIFVAGVHVIELAGTDTVDDLATRVAELALGPEPTAGPAEHLRRLGSDLREPTLIVLDNAEHVIDDCAAHAEDLLATSAHLTLLVTSREPLRIAGEHTFALSPLATDPTTGTGRSAGAQLFLDRVAAQGSGTTIDDELVDAIVQRLDGLPLALELAAAQVPLVGADVLLDNLEEALAAAPQRRGRDSRHRTVSAAIDWSYSRCDPLEQLLLTRLSVFRGSFDRDAVAAVCVDDALPSFGAVRALTALVDQSLVTLDDAGGQPRYRLLQLIRQFARERLDDHHTIDTRHGQHYLEVGRAAAPAIGAEASPDALARVSVDHDNFIAVLERGVADETQRPTARRLAVSLQSYWEDTGRLRLGADWLTALAEPHDIGDRAWAACVLIGTTYDAMCGLTPLGRTPVDTIRQFAEMGVPGAHAMQMSLAFVDLSQGALMSAIERFERAAVDFEDDPANAWQATVTAGALADYRGDPDTAAALYERADAIDQAALGAWAPAYRDIFVHGSRIGAAGVDATDSDVESLMDAWYQLHRTGLETRITIAGHRVLWALERSQRDDLIGEWFGPIIAFPNRTGYRWFTLALADLAAAVALRHERADLALPIEGAVDLELATAGYGFPETFHERRLRPERAGLDPVDAERMRDKGTGLTIAGLTALASDAVAGAASG
ncbi:MAG: adenylate/guanylate cyclase domain-containing protein [Actinomycetota bacterium]